MRTESHLQPRIIRASKTHEYFSIDKDIFNRNFRPFLTVIPLSNQAKGFDRLEMDRLMDHYSEAKGMPPEKTLEELYPKHEEPKFQESGSTHRQGATLSTKKSMATDFTNALRMAKASSLK